MTKFGGVNVINETFSFLVEADRIYLGYFLSARSTSAMPRAQEPNIPWHFLYNLALKHLNDPLISSNIQSDWETIVELSRDIAAAIDVERYSIWEDSQFSANGLNQAILDNVIYDELFAFPQWGGNMAVKLFGWWIDAMVTEGCPFPIASPETWRLVADSILSRSSQNGLTFRWVSDRLGRGIRGDLKAQMISALSSAASDLNIGYHTPFDTVNRTSLNFPMIRLDERRLLVLPRGLAARALYEAIFTLMRPLGGQELHNKLGRALERLTERVLLESGHQPEFTREKYKSKINNRIYECDAIVSVEQNIFLFECKRKALTNLSKSGNIPQVLIDMSKSFMQSLSQLARHQRELTKISNIEFLNGRTLEWHNRHIEKISVGMLDHGSMQSRIFISNLVKVLLFANVSSEIKQTDIELIKVNETVAELKLLIEEIARLDGEDLGRV